MPPNFVIIMVEHFGANLCPGYGSTPLRAPAIERFAAGSARFDQAHCPSPVCGPSRFAFLTGCHVHNTDAYDNGSTIPPWLPTYAHMLTAAGYRTLMCGRMHIHGLDTLHGFEERLSSEIIEPILGTQADMPAKLDPIRPLPPAKPIRTECPVTESAMHHHDEYVAQRAADFLRARPRDPDRRPFMLTVGFLGAHPGSNGNPAFAPLYRDYLSRDLPLPRFTPADYEALPEHIRRLHQICGAGREIFDPQYHRHERALHLARCEYMDGMVARVLDALRESGLDRDTVVLFTADHGDNFGEHGLWGKMNFYQEAQRVPLLVRVPGGAARGVDGRVSLIDILPTLAELAGVGTSFPIDGLSFAPALRGGATPRGRDGLLFSEYHGYRSPGSAYMVLKGPHKYCHYLHEPCELYDLDADPAERTDLGACPESEPVRRDLRAELARILDVDAFESTVTRYNLRRQAVFAALEASPVTRAATTARLAAFRRELNEPWWDGGEYMARERVKMKERKEKAR